jgi:multidrug efflux pump subunit AcrA (membrane-fusion protein)
LVVIVGVVFALSWVLPAMGASSPAKLAKKALATATKALSTAKNAQTSANKAQTSANGAQASADKAQTSADKAQTSADKAQTSADKAQGTANQALSTASGIPVPAYARMDNPCSTSSACSIDHAKGVSEIRQTSTGGLYCVTAPGYDPATTASIVSVDSGDTGAPAEETRAMPNSNRAACNAGEFEVQTTRGAANASNVAFFILIP